MNSNRRIYALLPEVQKVRITTRYNAIFLPGIKDVFPVFYAMEEEVRCSIRNPSRKQSALDVKQLSNAILSSEDVLFFWSIATVQSDENEKLLLKKITKL